MPNEAKQARYGSELTKIYGSHRFPSHVNVNEDGPEYTDQRWYFSS